VRISNKNSGQKINSIRTKSLLIGADVKLKSKMKTIKTKVLLSGIILFVAIAFFACEKSDTQQTEVNIDNIIYETVYEDLPVGCDSVQMISPENSIFESATRPDGELSASLFYYEDNKIVAVLSNGRVTTSRVFNNNQPISDELTVEGIVNETNLESSSIDSYTFSVFGKPILTMTKNSDGVWTKSSDSTWDSNGPQNGALQDFIDCVDRRSEEMCDGTDGSLSRVLCKLCSSCAVAAAATLCLIHGR